MKYRILTVIILSVTLALALIYSSSQEGSPGKGEPQVFGNSGSDQFVGDESCYSCHASEVAEWRGSHHDYSMKVADSSSVRGDFSNVVFKGAHGAYRFFKKNGRYMVEAPGPSGMATTYEITHTFGWEPLQQYLVDFGKGKLQALTVAWDTGQKRWFSLQPSEKVNPGDWLHWTGGAMNWNTMCADCHSTQLKQNYIPPADSFHTTWTSINVSCESCHGPGESHVKFMHSNEAGDASIDRIRKDLQLNNTSSQAQQINTCARCHSLREKLVDFYDHKKDFMDHFSPNLLIPNLYFPDGQIRQEVYVYGSFLQSKMYNKGIKCNDCHNSHSLSLKANVTDNTLCMNCHMPVYNSKKHTFHEPNTEASQCINCHMTGRYYMEVDFRRDHSFRIPRPDLSAKFNTPNACNGCHESESVEWAAEAVEKWYGTKRPDHYSESLLKADSLGAKALPEIERLINDTTQSDLARATAIWYLGQFETGNSLDLLKKVAKDENKLIRKSAARAIATLSNNEGKDILSDVLDDSVRAVRIAAAQGLAEFSVADFSPGLKQSFKIAIDEYRQYLGINQYSPSGLMNKGLFYEKNGETDNAIKMYRRALEKDSHFNPARLNLAYIYNRNGQNNEAIKLLEKIIDLEPGFGLAYYSLALLWAEEGDLQTAAPLFERAAILLPENTRILYNLAITYQKLKQPEAAEEEYLEAINLAPDNSDYRYGICTLYIQQKEYIKALPHARMLIRLNKDNLQFQKILQLVENKVN